MISHRNLDQDVFCARLRIFHLHIEISVFIEDSGVEQLKLRIVLGAAAIFVKKLLVGKLRLRIFVQKLHVGMGRGAVLIEVVFLHVLAMITFIAGKSEDAFLQDRIFAVPHRERETYLLMAVADAGDPIFIPAIGSRARVIVREVIPRRAIWAVILTHGSPSAFAYIGSPTLPMRAALAGFFESNLFSSHLCHS